MQRPALREEILQHEIIVEERAAKSRTSKCRDLQKKPPRQIARGHRASRPKSSSSKPIQTAPPKARWSRPSSTRAAVRWDRLIQRGPAAGRRVFVAGASSGKVRAMIEIPASSERGRAPLPVEVLGLSAVPAAGEPFTVVENEARAREVAAIARACSTASGLPARRLPSRNRSPRGLRHHGIPAGGQGPRPRLGRSDRPCLNRLSTDEIRVRILHSGVGAITEERRHFGRRQRRADSRVSTSAPQRQGARNSLDP